MDKAFIRFIKTDDQCTTDGVPRPGIPIFFTEKGIYEAPSDFMVYLRCTARRPASTVETYAFHIQKFLKYLRSLEDKDWKEVTDQTLIIWRDKMIDVDGLLDSTVNNYLLTVFAFYQWAEETGRVKNCVAIYNFDEVQGKIYQIAARNTKNRKWVWPYLLKVAHKPDRNTPTPQQLEEVHVRAFEESTTGQRDSLILSFYEDMGLRESEGLSLTLNDIPSWDDIDEAFEEDRPFIVTIWGKGNKKRYVPAVPELMRRAREYIEEGRAGTVLKSKRRNPAYRPPDALFISHTTGKKLNRQYLSRRISLLLKASGIEDVSGHRVRATYIETQVEAHDGYDESGRPLPAEQVMWKTQELVGHSSSQSTRPYLNKVRSRSYASKGDAILETEAKIKGLNRRLAEKAGAMKNMEELAHIAKVLSRGRTVEATRLLEELLEVVADVG